LPAIAALRWFGSALAGLLAFGWVGDRVGMVGVGSLAACTGAGWKNGLTGAESVKTD
jgi:hypothetical protein